MSLKSLNQLAINAKETYSNYNKEEVLLSGDFKALFSHLLNSSSDDLIKYSEYT
jgi:hypothetical protein